MSKPRYYWWAYAKAIIRAYPELKKEHDRLHEQRVTQNVGQVGSNHSLSRSTEAVALKTLPKSKQAEYDAVSKAIQKTMLLKTGTERLKLIDMVFWKQSHNLDGAAYALDYSYENAQRFHRDFIFLVGLFRGLCDSDDVA